MNKKWMAVSMLAMLVSVAAMAQTAPKKPTPAIKKDETIIVKKKGDSKEKLTIVVDGDKVTINGKPVEQFTDEDIEIISGDRAMAIAVAPKIRMAPRTPRPPTPYITTDDHYITTYDNVMHASNKALLGVITEKNEKGAKITEVNKETAAEKAGLKKGDIITKIDTAKIDDSEDLYKTIGKYKPEDKVSVSYLREGKTGKVTATLGKAKEDAWVWNGNSNFNFTLPDGNRDFAYSYPRKPKLGLQIQDVETGNGVKVLDVDDETPASKSGLKKDDIITEINGTVVKDVDDLKTKLKEYKEGDSFKVTYKRGDATQTAEIKYPKKLKTADL
jgi:serine protease Do